MKNEERRVAVARVVERHLSYITTVLFMFQRELITPDPDC